MATYWDSAPLTASEQSELASWVKLHGPTAVSRGCGFGAQDVIRKALRGKPISRVSADKIRFWLRCMLAKAVGND